MRIDIIELHNFRKLLAVRIDVAEKQTLFVGANNSGKTSAMVALRLFLKERSGFSVRDITASNWQAIEQIADSWRTLSEDEPRNPELLNILLPALDVWISVTDDELHHVADLIPSLDWESGLLGVRIRVEAKAFEEMAADYLEARANAETRLSTYRTGQQAPADDFSLWPKSFRDYLQRKFTSVFTLRAYLLDSGNLVSPAGDHRASPQTLPSSALPISGDPFTGLLQIREIKAQRGFADASDGRRSPEEELDIKSTGASRRLSDQLQAYYRRHLDPDKDPSDEDVSALDAFHTAQRTFDQRLEIGFRQAIDELQQLGYPGMANPKLSISTRLRPTDGLNHPSAVQYEVGGVGDPIRLPEDYSGLGFQNLISMVFLLMRFRDEWMRVGKFSFENGVDNDGTIPPLQLILVEEPEAHLHAQVQQVFIRKAYDVLRNHSDLGESAAYITQLIVSTHSSHITHEVDFSSLRYFKRQPAARGGVPTSVVANLTGLFGEDTKTKRFVRRYLRTTHCDLFFADGVILVEGSAERILLPHFIRRCFSNLAQRYISMLEIGGSHAHRLRSLIELLSIPTLIIADLDVVDPADNNKAVQPKEGRNLVTANAVLKTWVPKVTQLDDLLNEDKVPILKGVGFGVVGVVYQRKLDIVFPLGSKPATQIPSTFEDALILSNTSVAQNLSGVTMTNAFAKIVRESESADELARQIFDRLRERAEKAAFALDLLTSEEVKALVVPPYIADGLTWLEQQLSVLPDQL